METDPEGVSLALLSIVNNLSAGVLISMLILLVLILLSAMVSGSEVAFFSLNPAGKVSLSESNSRNDKTLLILLQHPEQLLATILITNNLVNVGIIVLSNFITESLFDFTEFKILGFFIQVILVTAILLLFGEILPKVYAARFSLQFSKFMAPPIFVLFKLLSPAGKLLIKSSAITKRKLSKKENFSIDDLSKAIDLTDTIVKADKDILKGIATFRHSDAKAIMKPRLDVVSIEISEPFGNLIKIAVVEGYSRIPVYQENFDNIKGIIYVKDLLPYLKENDDFNWQKLVREAFFIPETKKINVLLEEFREKKIHFAIVIDEYGGKSGIVTLEDILEEIVGEIQDETDEDETFYSKINEHTYIFDAKTSLNDFERVLSLDEEIISKLKGDAESLAGMILELKGEIPQKNQEINFKHFKFVVLEVDNRRIISVKVVLKQKLSELNKTK